MRHSRLLHGGLGVFMAGLSLGLAGCTHNYYYGNAVPVCGPVTAVPSTVSNGAVCEVPAQGGAGALLGQRSARSSIVTNVANSPIFDGARPPRVVVSTPISNGSRLGRWQRSDPEAITQVEGQFDETTTK